MDNTKRPPFIASKLIPKTLERNFLFLPLSEPIKSLPHQTLDMELLVVGDCHGKAPEISTEAEKADVILATGDICGDSSQMREAMFQSIDS